MNEVVSYLVFFGAVFLVLLLVRFGVLQYKEKRRPHVEFKCLEHMVSLTKWNEADYCWMCPVEDCEVWVDAGLRQQYEGVKPPHGA